MRAEQFFKQLTEFAQALSEEEQRHIAEQLTEEELAIFDLITKPDPTLTKKEEQDVKAQELLNTLKHEKLVLDWRKRQQSRAAVRVAIEEQLGPSSRDICPGAVDEEMQPRVRPRLRFVLRRRRECLRAVTYQAVARMRCLTVALSARS